MLKEPEPQVFFLNFGESTLDHELRIHVRDLGDRNPATDEINRFIDREFNKAGISIAFRQVDIFLKNLRGSSCSSAPLPNRPMATSRQPTIAPEERPASVVLQRPEQARLRRAMLASHAAPEAT